MPCFCPFSILGQFGEAPKAGLYMGIFLYASERDATSANAGDSVLALEAGGNDVQFKSLKQSSHFDRR
ncbi:hypothetical protein GB937_001388 [Aspergillus fischeri]|nr:hypothetical protein GB937_001388 [Aspergillus fischeri]